MPGQFAGQRPQSQPSLQPALSPFPPPYPLRPGNVATAQAVYAASPVVEPANHNTAPPERVRPLPDNVVPMHDRLERTAVIEQTAASAPVPTSLAQPTGPAILPVLSTSAAVSPAPSAALAELRSAAPADIKDLLQGVAVTQMRVAHDVAQAVRQIEDSQMAAAPKGVLIEGSAVQAPIPASDPDDAFASFDSLVTGREQQAWRDASPAVHDDIRQAFSGRGLANDPGLVDAGSIAARYAPVTQRPSS